VKSIKRYSQVILMINQVVFSLLVIGFSLLVFSFGLLVFWFNEKNANDNTGYSEKNYEFRFLN